MWASRPRLARAAEGGCPTYEKARPTQMPTLQSDLRRQLENVCVQARDVAEAAARSALQKRAVDVAEPFPHFGPLEKSLRNRLRARGRQVGDVRNADKTQSIDQLTQEL